MAEAPGPVERLTLTLKQSLALAERVYGECALIAANRDLSPAEAEIAREAAKLAWVEVRSARKALASHERANGLVVSSSARQPFSIKPDYPTVAKSEKKQGASLSGLSGAQLKAAWIQGQTLAALSLAQQEGTTGNYAAAHGSGDRLETFMSGGDQYDEPGPAPVAPSLDDFELTEDSANTLPKTWFDLFSSDFGRKTNQSPLMVYAIADFIAFISICDPNLQISVLSISYFLLFSFASSLPFLFLCALLAPIERKIYCYFSPNFSKYVSYRRAFDLYILEKRAHDNQVAEHEARIIRRQEAYWRSLSGLQFEREMGNLFHAMGYSVKHTPVTADGGVDLVLEKEGKRTVVQCKAHNKKISIEVARQLVASMLDFKAQSGIIACFDGATKPVVSYVAEREITILGIKDIVEITRRLQDSKTGRLN